MALRKATRISHGKHSHWDNKAIEKNNRKQLVCSELTHPWLVHNRNKKIRELVSPVKLTNKQVFLFSSPICLCVCVCVSLASNSSVTIETIIIKLGMVTAPEMVMLHVFNYIDLDLHSRSQILIINKCSIISESKWREITLLWLKAALPATSLFLWCCSFGLDHLVSLMSQFWDYMKNHVHPCKDWCKLLAWQKPTVRVFPKCYESEFFPTLHDNNIYWTLPCLMTLTYFQGQNSVRFVKMNVVHT